MAEIKPQLLGTAGRKTEPAIGEKTTHGGAVKNRLSTKITAEQHVGEFKEDFYADGN